MLFLSLFSLYSRPNCNDKPETSQCLENSQKKLSVTKNKIHPCCNLVGVTQSQLIVYMKQIRLLNEISGYREQLEKVNKRNVFFPGC